MLLVLAALAVLASGLAIGSEMAAKIRPTGPLARSAFTIIQLAISSVAAPLQHFSSAELVAEFGREEIILPGAKFHEAAVIELCKERLLRPVPRFLDLWFFRSNREAGAYRI